MLDTTCDKVLSKLTSEHSTQPTDAIGSGHPFQVRRRVGSRYNQRLFEFRFRGTVTAEGQKTVVEYKVMPAAPVWILAIFLLYVLLLGAYSLIFSDAAPHFTVAALAGNILLYLMLLPQLNQCVKSFERELNNL